MSNQILKELEAAAQIILAPPNMITQHQRNAAETVFLDFRKTSMPYQLCREILETSSVDYVLFESAGLIKTALVREWNLLPPDDIVSLKQYLLNYILNKPTLAPFVRERILQVIAIMVKRKSAEDSGEDRGMLLNQVESMVTSGDLKRQLLGCSIMSALMQEYATTAKSSAIGLTWELHFKAKQQFEVTDLKRIFKFVTTALAEFTKDVVPMETLPLIKHLLSIAEGVLIWGFIIFDSHMSQGLIRLFEDDSITPSLRPDKIWQDVILDPPIIQIFFTLYWKVRTNLQLAHHARSCLVQLASLNGNIMATHDIKIQYLSNYLQNFIKLISNIEIIDQEALGIANIVRRIPMYFGPTMKSLSPELLGSFMEQITRLTCIFAEGAAQEESICSDDYLYMEAFERMLESWSSILSKKNFYPVGFFDNSFVQIFNVYLKCRLSPPDGTRASNNEYEKEITDIEESDKNKFKKQLQILGLIARKIPNHTLILLSHLIENRTAKLRQELSQLTSSQGGSFVAHGTMNEALQNLYEDLHWLVLLAGHVLCLDSVGEVALIPSEMIKYSMKQAEQGKTDVDVTLQLITSPQCNLSDIPRAEESSDHVIRLTASVFRLCEIERSAIEANIISLLSPELISSVVWFLHQWSLNYLAPTENYYSEISISFIQAFGGDSAGAQWAVNFLLDNIKCIINFFKGEETLIEDTIKLLGTLVDSLTKAYHVLKSEQIGNLIELVTKNSLNLPQVAKRGVMSTVVQAGTALQNSSNEKLYWSQTIQPLYDQFKQIISRNDFSRSCHQEDVKIQITELFEFFIGIVQGARGSTAETIFQYICPILAEIANLLTIYHNYPQIVKLLIEFLFECSRTMSCYLNGEESTRLYEASWHTIQSYARCNTNRITTDSTDEENTYEDILLLMKLLTNLLSEDMFKIESLDPEASQKQSVTSADVFLYGLNIIMPMMTLELLKFPSLCHQYFKMITLICEVNPKKVCELPPELLKQLMASVELGFYSFGDDVTIICCDIIRIIAKYIYGESEKGHPKNQIIAPFMNIIMNLILSCQINFDLVHHASTPMYYLICCYQDQYKKLVENFIASQSNREVAQRLASAFNNLTANMTMNTEQSERTKFRDNFESFVMTVQSFMMIK
ncbi:exportin-4 [Microplitis demolitor]|uniref:exportin-4 n=1 Tax=Microplitis demolitor TaxID=69319 RepID=UPI0004CD6F3E|nr:exportin-4 [Microplitis demolitor]